MKIIIENFNDSITNDLIEVKSASYKNDYTLSIIFNDLSEKLIDFKPFLSKSHHPSISKYLNIDLFKSFEIKDGNLNWNDYDLIFPVYDLYEGNIG